MHGEISDGTYDSAFNNIDYDVGVVGVGDRDLISLMILVMSILAMSNDNFDSLLCISYDLSVDYIDDGDNDNIAND